MRLKLQIARKCKDIRQENGISVPEWAEYLGLKETQVKKMEKGIIEIPTLVLEQYLKLKMINEGKLPR